MNAKSQRICAFLGMMSPLVMFAGMIIGNILPPMQPSLDANNVVAFYQENAARIRICAVFMQLGGALMVVFASSVSAQLRRIEHKSAPVLSYIQMGSGFVTALAFILPAMIWVTATYRPERSPELTYLISDLGWIMFIGIWMPTLVENFATAFVILSDKREKPVFPRWLAYFNLWLSLLFTPSMIMPFFKVGPFAWNGLFAFWIPGAAFAAWFVVMYFCLLKAIKQQEIEES